MKQSPSYLQTRSVFYSIPWAGLRATGARSPVDLLHRLASRTMRVPFGLSCRRHLLCPSRTLRMETRTTAQAVLAGMIQRTNQYPRKRHAMAQERTRGLRSRPTTPARPTRRPSRLPAHPPRWYTWLPARPTPRARDDSVRQHSASEGRAVPPSHTTRTPMPEILPFSDILLLMWAGSALAPSAGRASWLMKAPHADSENGLPTSRRTV